LNTYIEIKNCFKFLADTFDFEPVSISNLITPYATMALSGSDIKGV